MAVYTRKPEFAEAEEVALGAVTVCYQLFSQFITCTQLPPVHALHHP